MTSNGGSFKPTTKATLTVEFRSSESVEFAIRCEGIAPVQLLVLAQYLRLIGEAQCGALWLRQMQSGSSTSMWTPPAK